MVNMLFQQSTYMRSHSQTILRERLCLRRITGNRISVSENTLWQFQLYTYTNMPALKPKRTIRNWEKVCRVDRDESSNISRDCFGHATPQHAYLYMFCVCCVIWIRMIVAKGRVRQQHNAMRSCNRVILAVARAFYFLVRVQIRLVNMFTSMYV